MKTQYTSIKKFISGAILSASVFSGSILYVPQLFAAPEKYVIDIAHSTLDFTASSFLLDTEGTFKDWSGNVVFDKEDITKSSVSVVIKVGSIDTRIHKRDEHLKGADFFDVAKYPEITFQSTKIVKTGEKTFGIVGDLTVHGVTKSITLPAKIDRLQDNFSRFKAEMQISRKAFGITFDSKMNPIEDNVSLKFTINIKKPE